MKAGTHSAHHPGGVGEGGGASTQQVQTESALFVTHKGFVLVASFEVTKLS